MASRVVLVMVMLMMVFVINCNCTSVGHMPSNKEEGQDFEEVKAKTTQTEDTGKEGTESWTEWAKEELSGHKHDEPNDKESTTKKVINTAGDTAHKTIDFTGDTAQKTKDYAGDTTQKTKDTKDKVSDYASDTAQKTKEKLQDVASGVSGFTSLPNSRILSQPFHVKRSCYSVIVGRRGSLNLIRVSFLYGNHDGKNKLPEFDLFVDVSLWKAVKFRNASEEVTLEMISIAQAEVTNICLVNKGGGTPRISTINVKPIHNSVYSTEFGENASMFLLKRWDIGSSTVRYVDTYDRIWYPYTSSSWDSISTSLAINVSGDGYRAPFEVIRTASRPRNESIPLEFSWIPDDPHSKFYIYLYFAEVEQLRQTQIRKINILWNGSPLFEPFIPHYLRATILSNTKPLVANEHQISIWKTEDSSLPPILNGVEIYEVRQLDALPTFEKDVKALLEIKENYGIQRNWMGDPCEPKSYSWEGIKCNYNTSVPPRIVSLNLSSRGLSGIITPSISNLSSLESLDLYNNSLTGSMPSFLGELKFLKYLNLKGNQLFGYVPATLLERRRAHLLILQVDDGNSNDLDSRKKRKKKISVVSLVASGSTILALLVVFVLYWKLRKNKQSEEEMNEVHENGATLMSKKWQYAYGELLEMTNNFQTVIGKGGFGQVYSGHMTDGTQVAVKMLSSSSSQGTREFQTEMANGNLKHYLSGANSHSLSWERRLQIAIDAAEGLNYLHHGCEPPIIHRDVKSDNILLGQDLEAKIADFGLSKMFKNDNQSGETSRHELLGTIGYIDPAQPPFMSEKTDTYSFGVILLELVTGRRAILDGSPPMHILDWIKPKLQTKDLNIIVDPKLEGKFDPDSAMKVVNIAMACTASASHRPTINVVLAKLKQCFQMESSRHIETFEVSRQLWSDLHISFDEISSADGESMYSTC